MEILLGETRMTFMIIKSAWECKPFSSAQLDRCEIVKSLSPHPNENLSSAFGQGHFAYIMEHGGSTGNRQRAAVLSSY
jgi:hypothetical protein